MPHNKKGTLKDLARVYRHKISIYRQVSGQDPFGQPIKEWRLFVEAWASIEPIIGREYWASNQVQAEVTHRIRTRYFMALAELDPSMRIILGNREFAIDSIKNIEEKNMHVEILAKEKSLVPDYNTGDALPQHAKDSEAVFGDADSYFGDSDAPLTTTVDKLFGG